MEYEILYDESKAPANFGHNLKKVTHVGFARLERCQDFVSIRLQVKDGTVAKLEWTGRGCSICLASASFMSRVIDGLSVESAREVYKAFADMMLTYGPFANVPESLLIFEAIRINPLKTQCVMVPWIALKNAIGA